nr:hypothetical protein [uncultured bacterium]
MRKVASRLTVAAALVGLIIHIGLGYRFGLLIIGIAIAAHLLVGVVARGWWRRRTST